jgi:hypothetical protein
MCASAVVSGIASGIGAAKCLLTAQGREVGVALEILLACREQVP